MRRRATAACAVVAALVSVASAHPAASLRPVVDTAALADPNAPARRLAVPRPALSGPIDEIAIIGDSIYFDHERTGTGPFNPTVSLIADALRQGLGDPDVEVRNLSRPGLAIAFPSIGPEYGFITLAEWLSTVLPDGVDGPDLVVIPATSIDLNLNQEVATDVLVADIVEELRRVVDGLRARGMQVVVIPAFGINDAMYDAIKSYGQPTPVRCEANTRRAALNAALNASDLPMLFPEFYDLDRDFDGDVDQDLFLDHNPGRAPDDGIHPNTVGHELIAARIGARLLDVIEPTR